MFLTFLSRIITGYEVLWLRSRNQAITVFTAWTSPQSHKKHATLIAVRQKQCWLFSSTFVKLFSSSSFLLIARWIRNVSVIPVCKYWKKQFNGNDMIFLKIAINLLLYHDIIMIGTFIESHRIYRLTAILFAFRIDPPYIRPISPLAIFSFHKRNWKDEITTGTAMRQLFISNADSFKDFWSFF